MRITHNSEYPAKPRDPVYGNFAVPASRLAPDWREDAFIAGARLQLLFHLPKYRRDMRPSSPRVISTIMGGRAGTGGRLSIITWTCARLTPTKDDF